MAQGEWEEAEQILSCASEAREAQGPEFRCYVQTLLAQLDVLRGYPGAALARLEPYASSPARIRDPLTLTVLATACDDTGQLAEAEEIVNLAVTRADLMQNLVVGLEASRVHARILAANGHLEQANVTLEESLSKARSMPCPYAEGKVLRDLGTLLGAEREKASERLSSALGIFRRLGAWEEVRETERALRATGIASV
jgi:tetratricopeptide (TPR) repeat protein